MAITPAESENFHVLIRAARAEGRIALIECVQPPPDGYVLLEGQEPDRVLMLCVLNPLPTNSPSGPRAYDPVPIALLLKPESIDPIAAAYRPVEAPGTVLLSPSNPPAAAVVPPDGAPPRPRRIVLPGRVDYHPYERAPYPYDER